MSRVANNPVSIPKGVEAEINALHISVKGPRGTLDMGFNENIEVNIDADQIMFATKDNGISNALAGTTRALVNNMVIGVSKGFEKKLKLVGVGYRAQMQGDKLNLTLGFSHPVEFTAPVGITIETPSQTEIVVKGINKQSVGQTAANIRAYRKPEPYKGKGVRYDDETIVLKEAKKK